MKKLLIVVAVIMFAASVAYAADCKICGNLNATDAAQRAGARICNGVCNAAFGWTEIFFRPGKTTSEGGNLLVGFFRGLGNAISRTAGGAVEVATFWTPGESVVKIDNCPLCAYSK